MKYLNFTIIAIIALSTSCKTMQPEKPGSTTQMAIRKSFFIYKTTQNYQNNVPVRLSEDGKMLIWFPGIGDVKTDNGFMKPIQLTKGYLYDQQGIGTDVAFLDFTYEQYSKLPQTPNPEVLMQHILDKKPLKEAWIITGREYIDINNINSLIENSFLKDAVQVVK